MTHVSSEQPEALRLADRMEWYCISHTIDTEMKDAAKELRRLHARVQELEASQAQRAPVSTHNRTHQYGPHKKYPCACETCGYPEHEQLMHGITQDK